MKENIQYQCEYCNFLYKTKEKALECEQSHLATILEVKSVFKVNNRYPYCIKVTFTNDFNTIYTNDYYEIAYFR